MGILPDWMIERDVKIEPFSPQQHRPGVISYGVTSYGYDVRVGYKWKVFDAIAGGVVDPKNFDPKLLREFDLTPYHEWRMAARPMPEKGDGLYTTVTCQNCKTDRTEDVCGPGKHCPHSRQPNYIIIPPNSYVLGESMETFTIPRDVACVCIGKSTYARCGIIVNVTPGEPEWEGKWTIEISNSSPLPAKVYCGEGIMQCMFIRSDGYRDTLYGAMRHLRKTSRFVKNLVLEWSARVQKDATCRVSYKDKKGIYQNQAGLTHARVVDRDK